MKELSPLRRTIGLVLIMIGGFWAAISLGFLEESFMTGQPIYTVLGALVVLAGVLVLVMRPKAAPPSEDPGVDAAPKA
jgi:drug/metabolite transporter superfamily protein YnfA